jgi:hypothetical protein
MRKLSQYLRRRPGSLRTAAAALLAALAAQCFMPGANAATFTEITIPGQPDHGIFDPSIASSGAGKLFMSFSGVHANKPGESFPLHAVRTYLAVSADQGKSWQLSGVINPDIAVTLGQTPFAGRWQSEVSTLLHDPDAPVLARWKLIWHQYLNAAGQRKFEHGWIAYKEAATPAGLASAKAVKLFTAAAYDPVNDASTGWTRSPIAGPGVNKVQTLNAALAGCIVVSEPALLSKPGALFMSLVCYKPAPAGQTGAINSIIMLRCARPCNAAAPGAWKYVGTALTPADAQSLSLNEFSASDLFSTGGQDYVMVSPVADTPVAGAYRGCVAFRFANIGAGQVERTINGAPAPAVSTTMDNASFNGACGFLPAGTAKGLLIGRVEFLKTATGADAVFHLFRSNVSP